MVKIVLTVLAVVITLVLFVGATRPDSFQGEDFMAIDGRTGKGAVYACRANRKAGQGRPAAHNHRGAGASWSGAA
jgi:hypothetical protein